MTPHETKAVKLGEKDEAQVIDNIIQLKGWAKCAPPHIDQEDRLIIAALIGTAIVTQSYSSGSLTLSKKMRLMQIAVKRIEQEYDQIIKNLTPEQP